MPSHVPLKSVLSGGGPGLAGGPASAGGPALAAGQTSMPSHVPLKSVLFGAGPRPAGGHTSMPSHVPLKSVLPGGPALALGAVETGAGCTDVGRGTFRRVVGHCGGTAGAAWVDGLAGGGGVEVVAGAADGDALNDVVGVGDEDGGDDVTEDVAGVEPREQPATNTIRANVAATNLLCTMRSLFRVNRGSECATN